MSDPDRTPDLENGGGVQPGSTPPADEQTSRQSDASPRSQGRTRRSIPPRAGAIALIVVAAVVAIAFVVFTAISLL